MPSCLLTVAPPGVVGSLAPGPHTGMEVAGVGLLRVMLLCLLLEDMDGVRRRTAEVRRRVMSRCVHNPGSQSQVVWSTT